MENLVPHVSASPWLFSFRITRSDDPAGGRAIPSLPVPRSRTIAALLNLQTRAHGHPIPKPPECRFIYMYLHAYQSRLTQMARMERQETGATGGRERGPLSPCVCRTLRMDSRGVTQLGVSAGRVLGP